jgi:hypothetical protein
LTAGEDLWSPNHHHGLVTAGGATDPNGDALTYTITGLTQDEPLDGAAEGHTSPDAAWADDPGQVDSALSGVGAATVAFTGSPSRSLTARAAANGRRYSASRMTAGSTAPGSSPRSSSAPSARNRTTRRARAGRARRDSPF